MRHSSAMSTLIGVVAVWAMLVLNVAAGCGGGDTTTTTVPPVCPNDTPATCPSPAPSYATDVAPMLQSRCGACHTPGGVEPGRLFQTWRQVSAQSTDILGQIHTCRMPPAGQPALTASERQAVLGWIVCGAVDN
jgi:mono/diheme cytochrome c family protein